MSDAAATTQQPFPTIREDMVARLSRQAADLQKPTQKPAPKKRWFH